MSRPLVATRVPRCSRPTLMARVCGFHNDSLTDNAHVWKVRGRQVYGEQQLLREHAEAEREAAQELIRERHPAEPSATL